MADQAPELQRAWQLCYMDASAARDIGRQLAAAGGPDAAAGWLHVALAEVRIGELAVAQQALAQARAGYTAAADARGLGLCGEVQAIALRRVNDFAGSAALQAQLDAGAPERDAMHSFIAHNSRAITAKLCGDPDSALRHFYAASDAAAQTGWDGPPITALCNLGGYHQDLFNLEDARSHSEGALEAARRAGARRTLVTVMANLVTIHYAAGDLHKCQEMTQRLLGLRHEMLPGALERCALPLALGHLAVGQIDAALAYLEPGAIGEVADGDGMTMWAWLKARCLLARGDLTGARAVAETTLQQRRLRQLADQPYELMELHRALADACEQGGDSVAALAYMREAHALYEKLVGHSARARYIALQITHELTQARRARDAAEDSRRSAEDDRRRLAELNIALQAQVAETEMLHAKLREQALRDPLTGLHNRRYLFEMAPQLLELARRQSKPLCVVLLDLDHFKLLNDTCGHAAGDLVLRRFSDLLTQMLRKSDLVCRHGGEEFVALMPEINAETAQAALERLLEAFRAQQSELGRRRLPRSSFSAGVAVFPRHGHTLEQLLSRADRGLYAAKNQGRARIEVAPKTGLGMLS